MLSKSFDSFIVILWLKLVKRLAREKVEIENCHGKLRRGHNEGGWDIDNQRIGRGANKTDETNNTGGRS